MRTQVEGPISVSLRVAAGFHHDPRNIVARNSSGRAFASVCNSVIIYADDQFPLVSGLIDQSTRVNDSIFEIGIAFRFFNEVLFGLSLPHEDVSAGFLTCFGIRLSAKFVERVLWVSSTHTRAHHDVADRRRSCFTNCINLGFLPNPIDDFWLTTLGESKHWASVFHFSGGAWGSRSANAQGVDGVPIECALDCAFVRHVANDDCRFVVDVQR
mmetsp:Transcript_21284/g.52742  ORF Transcript_21284/g.52742 Transcript_21284/m.52742 type:complete len:213 (-) Transcript_21284:337-975(-)